MVLAWVVFVIRRGELSAGWIRSLGLACAFGVLAMLLSDWPSEGLADFWAQHTVLASLLSSVLLLGLIFLVYSEQERQHQVEIDRSITAAGLGGIVDHMVDVEVALALLSRANPPDSAWPDWSADGRPLAWLRTHRDRLARISSGVGPNDPRGARVVLDADQHATTWGRELIDQSVRRLLASLRDWSPVIRGSRKSEAVLVEIAKLRNDLMGLSALGTVEAEDAVLELRWRLRILALCFERLSGASGLREEVLEVATGLEPRIFSGGEARPASTIRDLPRFDQLWKKQLDEVVKSLEVTRNA